MLIANKNFRFSWLSHQLISLSLSLYIYNYDASLTSSAASWKHPYWRQTTTTSTCDAAAVSVFCLVRKGKMMHEPSAMGVSTSSRLGCCLQLNGWNMMTHDERLKRPPCRNYLNCFLCFTVFSWIQFGRSWSFLSLPCLPGVDVGSSHQHGSG